MLTWRQEISTETERIAQTELKNMKKKMVEQKPAIKYTFWKIHCGEVQVETVESQNYHEANNILKERLGDIEGYYLRAAEVTNCE